VPDRVERGGGIVVDASAIVDLLCGTELEHAVEKRLSGERLLAPAHLDAEVLSALGRLHRGGHLTETEVVQRLELLAEAPVERRPISPLLVGAWRRRHNLRLVDALYVELAALLDDVPLITTDSGMASACPSAELLRT
jgi:predicted nucleic acid-binding protein